MIFSVQTFQPMGNDLLAGTWKQIRVFDGAWMGHETAKAAAITMASACADSAIVEEFHPGGTVSRGVVYQNPASDAQMNELDAQLTQAASAA